VVAGGFLANGSTSARVDLFDVAASRWHRGPDLPRPLNHASAAELLGHIVLAGGYNAGKPTTTALQLEANRWRPLTKLPEPRAAAGATALHGRLYVVGGVGPDGLAHAMLVYDPRSRRWTTVRGPTPRQHLAVVVGRGRVYAIGGRSFGYDTNTALVQSWAPGETTWRREPNLPTARGGTGAAAAGGVIVSAGSESPAGTSAAVYALDAGAKEWRRLPDLPTPRHGLGVVAVDGNVYVLAGGPRPGLSVSDANEALRLS
jgi:non-specific serine/threonine protein kinase